MSQYRLPDFVWGGQLTDQGRKVVAFLEEGVNKALSLVEGQNVTSLNHMSGPFQDYYVNVRCMTHYNHQPELWVKDRPYAVAAIWEQLSAEERAAADKAKADQTTTSLEARLEKVEKMITEALAKLMTEDDAPETPAAEEPVEEPEPPAKKRAAKPKPEAAEPPADSDAEETEAEAE